METKTTMILTPHLDCRDAADAYAFYQKAFGATPVFLLNAPDGRVMHATLQFGESQVYLVDEFLEHGAKSPLTLGGTPVTLHLQVPDCDAVFAQAVAAGCTVKMPLADMFWGDRWGMVADPFGHQWTIATPVREVSPEEMRTGMEAAMRPTAATA